MLATSRIRPARAQTQSNKPATIQVKSYPAPTAGLVTNTTMPQAQSAIAMENMWPTPEGVEPRRGYVEQCTVPGEVVTLFEHSGAGKYFAATASDIYGFDAATAGALSSSVSGLTSGKWVTYEVQNAGGNFLLCVNGADSMRRFDGTTWLTITGTGTGAITGVTTSELSFVWGHRNRVFFAKKDTLSAYYLATNAIGGAATELPLDAVFRKGGFLAMGGTWSSDSGSGMDDRCIFVSTKGEVAIYAGSNPGDINNWSLQGVYDVGVPLGRYSMQSVGGDVMFLTRDGIIPLSAVVSKDPSQLAGAAISAPIAPTLSASMNLLVGDWRLTKWDNGGMLIASPMVQGNVQVVIFAANTETGAWTTFTGWEASDIRGLGAALYFGTRTGNICRAWVGGNDNTASFLCRVMLAPDGLTDLAGTKAVGTMQATFKTTGTLSYSMGVAMNYGNDFGPPPVVASIAPAEATSEWGVAEWGVSFWSSGVVNYKIKAGWHGTNGVGFAVSPWVQIVSGSAPWLNAKLQRVDVTFTVGGVQL